MCGFVPVISAIGGALGSALMGKQSSPQVQAPQIQQYTPDESNTPSVTAPPAPTATPVMGQKGADELKKDAGNDTLKKNKKGRAALRIDRERTPLTPGAGGQVASGTVIPRG